MNMSGSYQTPIYNQPVQYGQQYVSYNPYVTQARVDTNQNYAQTLQQVQPQMPVQNLGINGKVVPAVENITANDVPMDGSVAFFPKQDMTEIYAKSWNADGTIRTIVFKPVSRDTISNLSHDTEKLKFDLSDECTGAFMQKFDELFGKIEQIENRLDKIPSVQRKTSQAKKESDAE